MGTLSEQRPREDTIKVVALNGLCQMLDIMEVPHDKATREDWLCACRMLEVSLKYQSADVMDEQLAGFGELMQELINTIKELGEDKSWVSNFKEE